MTPEEAASLDESLPTWGLEEKAIDEVTIKDLENLCEQTAIHERKILQLQEQLDTEAEGKGVKLETIRRYITHFGKTNYQSAFGLVEMRSRLSVKVPQSVEDKKALFAYLDGKGAELGWEYFSINSQRLNSMYKQESEIAKEEGRDCKIPGVVDASEFSTIHFKIKK